VIHIWEGAPLPMDDARSDTTRRSGP
jgi:hypothetical protein